MSLSVQNGKRGAQFMSAYCRYVVYYNAVIVYLLACGGSAAVAVAAAAAWRQLGGSLAAAWWQLGVSLAAAWRKLGGGGNGGGGKGGGSSGGDGQRINSATPAGMATAAVDAATTVLPPRAAMVAMKTPAVTAMAGAQTTINNQLKAANGGGRTLAA